MSLILVDGDSSESVKLMHTCMSAFIHICLHTSTPSFLLFSHVYTTLLFTPYLPATPLPDPNSHLFFPPPFPFFPPIYLPCPYPLILPFLVLTLPLLPFLILTLFFTNPYSHPLLLPSFPLSFPSPSPLPFLVLILFPFLSLHVPQVQGPEPRRDDASSPTPTEISTTARASC